MADRLRIVAVVQARTTSVRLPAKVTADVVGAPLLTRLLRRVRRATECDVVGVATTVDPIDDVVVELARSEGVAVVRGPVQDVLERFRIAAEELEADAVVRLTGDCPLVDPAIVDHVVRRFRDSGVDYASNVHPPTFPDGLDVEVVSRAALDNAAREAQLASEREHVTLYVAERPERFTHSNVERTDDLSAMRWTVDYVDDLEFVRAVFRRFAPRDDFGMEDVLAALAADPALATLMATHERNEGLDISRRAD